MFLLLFLFFSMLLLCSIFRLKELFQVKNGLMAFSFFEHAGRTTLNGEKKEDGLNVFKKFNLNHAFLNF